MIDDTVGAFAEILSQPIVEGKGTLSGLNFAAKDNFELAGRVAGNGNPTWKKTADPSEETSPVLASVLAQGAELVGFTHMDELAYSIIGANAHSGTPVNTAAPERVPGGSSSGSAAAVAASLVDFALGSDTGGSVRVPSAFCGLYGLRTSHGRLSGKGLLPLAPSFDVPGWFARDLEVMQRVADALDITVSGAFDPADIRLWMPEDVWSIVGEDVRAALEPWVVKLEAQFGAVDRSPLPVVSDAPMLKDWFEIFRIHQAYEVWQCLGSWVSQNDPVFGPGVSDRFEAASKITFEAFEDAQAKRLTIRNAMDAALTPGKVLVMPTTPGAAPMLDADQAAMQAYREAVMCLTSISGLNGYPELSVPGALVDGAPQGLSLVAPRGCDRDLLELVHSVG